ncbi:MAG TPA: hypothetical protein VGZ47_06855 [Gemmataceae bacterium]|nr:hypothetical protein [Gemmataceae bacterium]
MPRIWKKGRGKLGFLQPLLGQWLAETESPIGPMRCSRIFEEVLGGSYIRLQARWEMASATAREQLPESYKSRGPYEEIAIIGVGDDGEVCFWSFTSDGKHSQGAVADVSDLHPEAIGFEAQMPAGLARMAYWPDENGGFIWVVESKNAKGWRRFTEHHYHPLPSSAKLK